MVTGRRLYDMKAVSVPDSVCFAFDLAFKEYCSQLQWVFMQGGYINFQNFRTFYSRASNFRTKFLDEIFINFGQLRTKFLTFSNG